MDEPNELIPAPDTVETPAAPVEAAPEAPSEMQQWVDSAKLIGYESRLGEGQTMEDLYREMHGIEATPEVVVDDSTLEVPADVDADASLTIEEPAEVEETPASDRPSAEVWNDWAAEIDTTGSLADSSREKIKQGFGFDDSIIDTFLAGRKAMQRDSYSQAAPVVGGEAELKSILEWAGSNLSAEERTANNAALLGPQRDTVLLGLKARYQADNPTKVAKAAEPAPLKDKATVAADTAVKAFESQHEMVAAMQDQRYRTSEAYRKEVSDRVNASQFLY